MRWKIGSRDRDSRQIDLIVVLALLIVILAAFRFYNGDSNKPSTTALFRGPSEFGYFLREPVIAVQPLVLFLDEMTVHHALGGLRFRVWLGRENRIIAIKPALGAVVHIKASLQFLRDRCGLGGIRDRRSFFAPRFHL